MSGLHSFENLDCWKKARTLRNKISKEVCGVLPKDERYLLKSQLLRASRSVSANIAEGFGRYTYKESSHFLIIARGSLFEVLDHIIVCYDEEYIDQTLLLNLKSLIFENLKVLNGYLRYLRSQK